MELDDLLSILRSKTYRRILPLLYASPKTVDDIYSMINDVSYNTIYRALNIFVNMGIVNKYYEQSVKKLKYELIVNKITLNLEKMEVKINNN